MKELSRSSQHTGLFYFPVWLGIGTGQLSEFNLGAFLSQRRTFQTRAGGFLLRRWFCESQCFEPVIKSINPMIAGRTLDCHSKTVAAGLVDVDLGIRTSCL
jgi:hypothetical protein